MFDSKFESKFGTSINSVSTIAEDTDSQLDAEAEGQTHELPSGDHGHSPSRCRLQF